MIIFRVDQRRLTQIRMGKYIFQILKTQLLLQFLFSCFSLIIKFLIQYKLLALLFSLRLKWIWFYIEWIILIVLIMLHLSYVIRNIYLLGLVLNLIYKLVLHKVLILLLQVLICIECLLVELVIIYLIGRDCHVVL